ncbi:hypothetical protein [Hymenobacter sp. BRD67]|uniref:hypothetical protein n=1 Tax=Hymenobacter sp. BRD67 TaxID=2675877 RepID=UPI001564C3BF|nr:hypothetical protein [Hymenobacter sp. BRD67]QKG52880.1 hypothetical protein GKZ67_10030 [Hymenobacter sp. BRD67]
MKKLYSLLALVLAGTACQQQATPTHAVALLPTEVAATVAPQKLNLPSQLLAADTLTPPMLALLQAYDLSPLWRGHELGALDSVTVLDGFFGLDHYRISFVFTQVRQDTVDKAVFHIAGKSRYKSQILPFAGLLRVQRLADLDHHYLDLAPEDSSAQGYTANASFTFEENAAGPNAGNFEGVAILDFYISSKGEVNYAQIMGGEGAPARGQGLLIKGSWISNKNGQKKDLLLARSVFSIAPDVLKNFSIGDRDATINPKYAKLGWNNYWKNDEWWAETPKPSLNL